MLMIGIRRLEPALEFGVGSTTSTPLSTRKGKATLELCRQRSLDSETAAKTAPTTATSKTPSPLAGGGGGGQATTPVRNKPTELFYRDGSLSRSLSFMQQRRPQTVSFPFPP